MNPEVWRWTLTLYDIWVQSNFISWPYQGGSANQPAWVIHDFNIFSLVDEWLSINRPTLDESRRSNPDAMDD